ncbi:MAG: hypothetical protein SGI89_11830 [bacterium]|nr:hypothetical protein [bacterium]
MKSVLLFLIILFLQNPALSQDDPASILDLTLEFRGLSRDDITIPINFDKDKSPTNDSKLLLPVVKDLMTKPLGSMTFMDKISGYTDLNTRELILKLYELCGYYDKSTFNESYLSKQNKSFEGIVRRILEFVDIKKKNGIDLRKKFTKEEINFLNKNLLSLIQETETEDNSNSDIFKFNRSRDSSIAISKRTMDILSDDKHFTKRMMYSDFMTVIDIYEQLSHKTSLIIDGVIQKDIFDNSETDEMNTSNIQGNFLYYNDDNGIRVAIGGKEKNIYNGHFDFIIDLGGDDVYNIDKESNDLFSDNFSCIIDLSGNDYYSSNSNYTLAGSVFSSGFIFDKEGDDTYKGKNVSLGSAICGLGVLFDESGNDTYQANQFSIGAAAFGAGLLLDRQGNDVYIANSYSQGFGMTEGAGAIVDNKGNDSYLIDARSLDIGRYEDHYVSMSQGYGLGLRPYYAGGVGLIVEGEGNDIYNSDIFGQGGAYWYALGCITDKSGHDKYNGYQYSQGAGIHLAVGLLKDYDGWDFYSSNGVSQGCGHDFGFGFLDDVKGNDNYSAYSLSQGAGNANGIGLFIDESGRDGYLHKEPGNTRGYGNSRREYGSLGIFVDGSGDDFYSSQSDSVISNSSMWGVMNDFYLKDLQSQASGNSFRIPLDSNKNYSTGELFIMAKTIEPRFSLWQEYGFRKLVDDSVNTTEYLIRYLDTEDHRLGLVLRNLAFKIGYTMGNFLDDKLRLYNSSMSATPLFNQNQIAYICYLFGETGNPIAREQLLNLTDNENIRIRSVAINALGKIKYDSTDNDFIFRASQKLRELALQPSQYRLYKKDIAYAFKNYFNFDNIVVLIQLMRDDYFGVRFLAAEDLRAYGDEYYHHIDNALLEQISSDKLWYQSFLNSILGLSEKNFSSVYEDLPTTNEDLNILSRINILKQKTNLSNDNSFKEWAENIINTLQNKNLLHVK